MYKRKEKIKEISSFEINDKYVFFTDSSKNGRLIVQNHQAETLFVSDEFLVNSFCTVDDTLCYSAYEQKYTVIYNLKSAQTKKVDFVLALDKHKLYGYLSYNIPSKILPEYKSGIYNLHNGEMVAHFSKPIAGYIKRITKDYIITSEDGILYVYSNQDFTFLWQKDIGEMTQYRWLFGTTERGNIRDIHEYKDDSIVVLTDIFIVQLNINTGDILYLQRLPRGLISISIIDNKAYGCYVSSYMEIDLDNGEVINYIDMDKVEYQGEKYDAEMGLNRLHAGYLYHDVRLDGGVFGIGAINIRTGVREWVDVLGVHSVFEIQFHQNRMYIEDSEDNLYIYEKSI